MTRLAKNDIVITPLGKAVIESPNGVDLFGEPSALVKIYKDDAKYEMKTKYEFRMVRKENICPVINWKYLIIHKCLTLS